MKKLISNEWASKVTAEEVQNWIESMIDCGRVESAPRYWSGRGAIVRCPFGEPLAWVA